MPFTNLHHHIIAAGLLMIMSVGNQASAQEPSGSTALPRDDLWTVTGVLENDVFADSDGHYTNGVLVSALSPQNETLGLSPNFWGWLPGHDSTSKRRINLQFGQSMFTPDDIKIAAPQPEERPWGAWLHGSVSLVSERTDELSSFTLDLGMAGPAALGEESQSFIHDVLQAPEPQGWDNQIGNEPTIMLAYDRRWQKIVYFSPESELGFDLMPHLSGALGNAFTYAGGGATLRFGKNLANDFGPLSIAPGTIGSSLHRSGDGLSWSIFTGSQGRYVARNIFLDGNIFRESPSVNKKSLVGDLYFGASLNFGQTKLTSAYVIRSKEFDGQAVPDEFVSLTVAAKF